VGEGAHLLSMIVGVKKEVGGQAPHQRQGQRWPDLVFTGAGGRRGLGSQA
jgi:hypothetical protein